MIGRIVSVVVVGFVLSGHLPRSVVTGQHAWILWLLATVVVFGAPHVLRASARRVFALGRRPRPPVR